MNILGLDCATKTGWAIYDSETKKVIESGVQDFAKKRGESNGIMFLRYRKWLKDLLGFLPKIDVACYEQAHHRGGAATEVCVGMTTRVQEAASEKGIECLPVRTTVLKKWATGKGNAGKDLMMKAATPFLGRDPIDDNEADAVLIAVWAAGEIG